MTHTDRFPIFIRLYRIFQNVVFDVSSNLFVIMWLHQILLRCRCRQPFVFEQLLSIFTFLGVTLEHRNHKIFEKSSLILLVSISLLTQNYLAIMTSFNDQFWRRGILFRHPVFDIYFLAFSPLIDIFLGNLPSNYIIWARWSSFLPNF